MANSLEWIDATYWTPASEASLIGWWKADSLALNNNDLVASWADSSPSGFTMTQSSGANKPTYRTNVKNGLPAVIFDGANSYLVSSMPSNTKPFTIAAVMQSSHFSTHFSGLFGSTTDGDLQWLTVLDQMRMDTQNTATIATPSVGFTDGLWYVCIATYDSSGNWAYLVNGTAFSGTNNKSFTGGGVTNMGTRNVDSNFMDGYIAEIMKFSAVVSTSTIDTYLNGKWATH